MDFSASKALLVKNTMTRSLPGSPSSIHQLLQNNIAIVNRHDNLDTKSEETTMSMSTNNCNGQAGNSTSRRARSNNFTVPETFALLNIWSDSSKHGQTNYCPRNFHGWDAVSFWMRDIGYDRTALQCKNRIQNLTSNFYRIQKSDQNHRSGNFPYYDVISDVLDKKPADNDNSSSTASFTTSSGSLTISPLPSNPVKDCKRAQVVSNASSHVSTSLPMSPTKIKLEPVTDIQSAVQEGQPVSKKSKVHSNPVPTNSTSSVSPNILNKSNPDEQRPAKRSKGKSSSPSVTAALDQYLMELVGIEKQWLSIERQRAEYERLTMESIVRLLHGMVRSQSGDETDGDA